MAYGPARATVVQHGRESTAGTLVAATTQLRLVNPPDIEDLRKWERVDESIGLVAPTTRQYNPSLFAQWQWPSSPMTFQQWPHVLEAGIKAATPGASTAYLRTYPLPVANTPNTLKTATIESGNAVAGDASVMEYAFVESFTMEGAAGTEPGAWMGSALYKGRQKAVQSLTGSLSAPSVEEMLFAKTKLYIDDSGGTIGSTQKSAVLIKAKIDVKTGWTPIWTADGNKYFQTIKYVVPMDQVKFALTFELENTAGVVAAERAKYVAGSLRLIQLLCDGSTSDYQMKINIVGRWEKFATWTNTNGNISVEASGYGLYSSTDTEYFTIAIKNGVATLP